MAQNQTGNLMNQFQILQPWMPQILNAIKREIKTEHLPGAPVFHRAHFGSKPISRLTAEEMFKAYETELVGGNQELAEWVINRWVFKHGDMYNHFAKRLSEINPNFEEIKTITEAQADYILDGATEAFGPINLFLFSLLNGVVFPEVVLNRLKSAAEQALKVSETSESQKIETLEERVARYQKEISKIEEKCELKIAGVMKKYATDVESLKKQIRSLQQRLNTVSK